MFTFVITVVLAFAPGVLLGFVLPSGRYRLVAWAAAPASTLGLVSVASSWLMTLGLPDGPVAVLVAEFTLAAAAVATVRVVMRQRTAGDSAVKPSLSWWSRMRAAIGVNRPEDVLAVGVPMVLTMGFGAILFRGLGGVPGWDGMNHAFFVRRMIESGTTAIEQVCVTGSFEAKVSCGFYPLAADIQWAQGAILGGGRVSTAMLAWVVVVAPVAMVTGVYSAVRLLGGARVVAAAAAFMPALVGPDWAAVRTGRITEQSSPAMAAAVALVLALALRGRHPLRLGAIAGLSVVGIVMSHTYDVLFIGTLALLFFIFWPRSGRLIARHWRRMMMSVGVMALVGAFALGPVLGGLLGASAERAMNAPASPHFTSALEYWFADFNRYLLFGYPQPGSSLGTQNVATIGIALWVVMVLLSASLMSLVLPSLRWARPWFLSALVWTLVGAWTSSSDSTAAQALAGLWYGVRERVRTMIAPTIGVLVVAGACVLGLVLWWLAARVWARLRHRQSPAAFSAVTAAAVVVLLGLLAVQPSSWRPIRQDLVRRSPVGDQYVATFEWLKSNIQSGGVVATDRNVEFMSWANGDFGVPALFGIPPLDPASKTQYARRTSAFRWLVNVPKAPDAGCDVLEFGVQYVALGNRTMPGWERTYQPSRVSQTDRLRLVHEDRGLRVYEVTPAGRACSS